MHIVSNIVTSDIIYTQFYKLVPAEEDEAKNKHKKL